MNVFHIPWSLNLASLVALWRPLAAGVVGLMFLFVGTRHFVVALW